MAIIGDNPAICQAERFVTLWHDDSTTIGAHTSGSTGIPKMVNLPKSDMRASARATCQFFGIGPGSLLFLPLPIDYIAGKMMIVRAEESNSDLMVEPPSNTPLRSAPPIPVDLAAIVPSQVPGLLASPWVGQIRNLLVGGAPLSQAHETMLAQSPVKAFATYGMTETASHVALRPIGTDTYRAMPHVSFSTDDRGCLTVHSDSMSFGTLVTNDLVELTSPHSFRWLGRHDNVINSGGIKVLPEKIEEKLAGLLPEGIQFYIASRPSEKWGSEVVIVVESPEPIDMPDFSAMPTLLKAERPKQVIFQPRFERTRSGKIIRQKSF